MSRLVPCRPGLTGATRREPSRPTGRDREDRAEWVAARHLHTKSAGISAFCGGKPPYVSLAILLILMGALVSCGRCEVPV